jgi:hypothetical protein
MPAMVTDEDQLCLGYIQSNCTACDCCCLWMDGVFSCMGYPNCKEPWRAYLWKYIRCIWVQSTSTAKCWSVWKYLNRSYIGSLQNVGNLGFHSVRWVLNDAVDKYKFRMLYFMWDSTKSHKRHWTYWLTEERYWALFYMPLVTEEHYWALFYMPLYMFFTQFSECTGTDCK